MRARIGGGIAGWLIGVVPLIVVNFLDYQDLLALQDALVAGLIALIGGIVVGGIAAGWLGGHRGGTPSAAFAGAMAAVLYAVTLIGLVIGAGILDSTSPLIAMHPLRISMALIFLATILLAIAIATGAIVGHRANTAPTRSTSYQSPLLARTPQVPYDTYHGRFPGQPHAQSRPRDATNGDTRAPGGTRSSASYGSSASRPLPPDASDPRYATSRSRSAGSSGSRRDQRPPSSSHDSDWRRPGR